MSKPTSYYQRDVMQGDVSNIQILNKENDRFKLLFVLTYVEKYFDKITNKSVKSITKWNCEVRSKYAEVLSKKLVDGMFVFIEGKIKLDNTSKEGIKFVVTFVTPVFFEDEKELTNE